MKETFNNNGRLKNCLIFKQMLHPITHFVLSQTPYRSALVVLCILFSTFSGLAQERGEVMLSKNFKFQDGLYFSFSDFKNNAPQFHWDTLDAHLFVNPQTLIAKVNTIHLKMEEGNQAIVLDSLWGFSLGGIPYIRLPKGTVSESFQVFAGIKLRGKICYYAYQEEVTKEVAMPIYNPLTRRPFYQTTVTRSFPEVREWMLDFETGKMETFNLTNFKTWIQDDPSLLKTVEEFDAQKAEERMFKCLLIYDDRNLVKIKETIIDTTETKPIKE